MINKKLLSFDRKALRYVGLNVLFQWLGMLCNVVLVITVSRLIGGVFAGLFCTCCKECHLPVC